MLNYVNAEFYKVSRRKYPYVTFLCITGLACLLLAGFVFVNSGGGHTDFEKGGLSAVMTLSVGLYMAILVGDMVFSDQYKHNTLKNEVSFGVPRARIYLGKLAVEAVVGVVMSLLVLGIYEVLCYLLLYPSEPEATLRAWTILGYCVLAAMPQWLAALALTNLFFFLVRGNTLASFLVLGVLTVPGVAFELTALLVSYRFPDVGRALVFLRDCMPGKVIEDASGAVGDWTFMGKSWLLGLIWIVVCSAIGLAGFQKKEIN